MKHKLILILLALTFGAFSSPAFNASIYSKQSRFASGKWVKIRTTGQGIYQLTYDQLRDLGFKDPAKVQVYGYGGLALPALNNAFVEDFPDDIQPVATRHTADNRILFFGQGDVYFRANAPGAFASTKDTDFITRVRNTYDTASYYFLSDCGGSVDIPVLDKIAEVDTYAPVKSHAHVDFIENELQNPSGGGVIYHGNSFEAGTSVPYTFTVKNFLPSAQYPNGTFYYKFGVKSETKTALTVGLPQGLTAVKSENYSSNSFSTTDNSADLYLVYKDARGYVNFSKKETVPDTDEDLTFNVKIPSNNLNYCGEDFVVLCYPRANRLDSQNPCLIVNFLKKEKNAGQKVVFDNVDGNNFEIWSLDGYAPAAFPLSFEDGTASFVLDGNNSTAVAFNPAATFDSPEIIGDIPNQNLHAEKTPDMLIITVDDQVEEAYQFADIHKQYQNMDVLIVSHEKVYNEFSSGTRDAMAYRRLAKMFYDRDPGKFRFLMFLGPTYYDNRCILGTYVDRLVCFEQDDVAYCNSTVSNYAMDTYFGMLNDDYDHSKIYMARMQINVGRVPSINPSQVASYAAKVRERFENPMPADVYNHIVLLAGTGNNATHSIQANEVIENVRKVNSSISFSPVYAEAFASVNSGGVYNSIVAGLSRGAGMFTFIGHGAPTMVEGWGISNVNATKYTYAPFVMFSSCDQFAFDHSSNGLTATMLFERDGGALGGVAAVRSVYMDFNQYVCVPVSIEYARAKPGDTFGDVFRLSRDYYMARTDMNPVIYEKPFRNMLSFNLAGDPAIPVNVPTHVAELKNIGNKVASGPVTIRPLESFVFKGEVKNNGVKDSSFNGVLRLEVFDGAHSAQTHSSESGYTPNTVTFDSEVLATVFGEVRKGEFAVNTVVPPPAFPAQSYRVVITATSDNGNAIGSYNSLKIAEFEPDTGEGEYDAPEILEFYADDPKFLNGDEVSASCTVYAVINPSESGLNTMTANVNTRTHITVDGSISMNNLEGFFSRRDDGYLDLAVPLKDLSDGIHIVDLFISNNVGQIAQKSIEITTTRRNIRPEIFVEEAPASSVATINIDGVDNPDFSRLIITDAAGNTVHSVAQPAFPYKWDFSADSDITDGLYNVSVLVKSGNDYGSTPRASIIVLR